MSERLDADVAIIGAGLSGLVDAILLAETGRRVVVVERHRVPGGYLQQFRRRHTWFDVGFHYMGSTAPGRPMRQFLEHLEVWDRLEMLPLPADDAIRVVKDGRAFGYPATWERFREKGLESFPAERDAFERLVRETDEVTAAYKWFDLEKGRRYQHPLDLGHEPISFQEYMDRFLADPWLKEVLAFQSFNLGLFAHEIPYVKHLLAFRSNFDVTSRIRGGGGALVAALVERGRRLGVDYRFRWEAAHFRCDGRRLVAVENAAGDVLAAGLFVAACHPKVILSRIADADVHPMYKERVLALDDSRGALQLFIRLERHPRSLGETCVLLHGGDEARGDPPIHSVLVTCPSLAEGSGAGGPRLEAMTYMDQEPFARWRDTRSMRRGAEYDGFKEELVRRMLSVVERLVPELREIARDRYAATPLTDEWYTLNAHGGVFGVSHALHQQGLRRPQPRVRLKNLFFTGHSIQMPGICGVFINAFDTCDQIRGDGRLFEAVAT